MAVLDRHGNPIPVERAASQIISLKPTEQRQPAPSGYSTYTSMYKSHPIVRAVIDKIARTCVATGYTFVPRDKMQPLNEAKATQLHEIFARSKSTALLRQTYTDLLVYGDAYWAMVPSRLGAPYAFMRIHPSMLSIVIDLETREETQYIYRDKQGIETASPATDYLHFKLFDPDNDVYGLSPLESLKSTVAQDLYAQTFNEAFFANSATTGTIFNMKGASTAEVERNREFLKKEYVGGQNAHKPLVLEGDIDVQKSVATPAEMQFIEGRKQLTQEILAVYDLPYTKLGGTSETANRSQSAENDKSYRAETIVPLQSVIEEVINEQFIFLVMKTDDTLFQHKEVDNRDEREVTEVAIEKVTHGLMTLNQYNQLVGQPSIGPAGDKPFLQTSTGVILVDDLEAVSKALTTAKATVPPNASGGEGPQEAPAPPKTGARPPAPKVGN